MSFITYFLKDPNLLINLIIENLHNSIYYMKSNFKKIESFEKLFILNKKIKII